MNGQEIEVKFYVSDLRTIIASLIKLNAELKYPRVHEVNLRFDTPDKELSSRYQVLRLRQDSRTRLTFKGPATNEQGISKRQEIEFAVSDLDSAKDLLKALGYDIFMMYEKYRTTYILDQCEIVLDEMPFGKFVEIEGPDAETIKQTAGLLGLNWDTGCSESYMTLFETFKNNRHKTMNDLSFAAFDGLNVRPQDLGLTPANCN